LIRQYGGQRCRGGHNPLRVGVIPIGAIFYIQDEGWWRDRYRDAPVCRNPWIVEAFLNGTIAAARRNRDTGLWEDVYFAGRSDMALLRSLRDGRRRQIAVRTLILHEEHGLTAGPVGYPDLPDLRLWRMSPAGHKTRTSAVASAPIGDTDSLGHLSRLYWPGRTASPALQGRELLASNSR